MNSEQPMSTQGSGTNDINSANSIGNIGELVANLSETPASTSVDSNSANSTGSSNELLANLSGIPTSTTVSYGNVAALQPQPVPEPEATVPLLVLGAAFLLWSRFKRVKRA